MADQTILVDLEPRAAWILGGIANLGEVDNDWTIVVTSNSLSGASPVTRLLVHLNSDSATSRNGTDTSNDQFSYLSLPTRPSGHCKGVDAFRAVDNGSHCSRGGFTCSNNVYLRAGAKTSFTALPK